MGLIALLDDVAALAKVAAASLDDVAAQATKAGAKAAGIVIDDAAVTPRYVVGFAASRELPIIWKIAVGSLKNKILFLLPGALVLSLVAPWLIPPLLMIGGAYLCFEGYEKVHHLLVPHDAHHAEAVAISDVLVDSKALEDEKISGAIKTDFILSAEIMAITLSTVSTAPLWMQALVLGAVGIGMTVLVYGVVALIVKADDAGVVFARSDRPISAFSRVLRPRPEPAAQPAPWPIDRAVSPVTKALGRGLVSGMPVFLKYLSLVGTAAMLWVGGGIIIHTLAGYGLGGLEHGIHDVAHAIGSVMGPVAGFIEWLITATASGVFGLAVGAAVVPFLTYVATPLMRRMKARTEPAA
jgi:hypothetical protein